MRECPNCGHKDYSGLYSFCGCTWNEQIQASRIKEIEKRKTGRKKVIVDDLSPPEIGSPMPRNGRN